jgi:uncharacterized membrane protein (DUF4010 family)
MMQKGKLTAETARVAVILGAISNTVLKVGYSWVMGHVKLAKRVTAVMGLSILGGVLSLLVL